MRGLEFGFNVSHLKVLSALPLPVPFQHAVPDAGLRARDAGNALHRQVGFEVIPTC